MAKKKTKTRSPKDIIKAIKDLHKEEEDLFRELENSCCKVKGHCGTCDDDEWK